MNTREVIISFIVLILLLVGFFLLLRLGKQHAASETGSQDIESGALPTTQNVKPEQNLEEGTGIASPDDLMFETEQTENPEHNTQGFEAQRTQLDKQLPPPPDMLKPDVDYQAVIKTSMGDIKVDLFENDTPNTVNNFIYLANRAFYDGLTFHSVIPDFMIQGGDPLGNGMGGPGYTFDDEIRNKLHFLKGSLGMANSGKNTNGSQFFIVTADKAPWLDKSYTNFGQVIEGQDIADKISMVERDSNDKPLQDVKINTVVILEN